MPAQTLAADWPATHAAFVPVPATRVGGFLGGWIDRNRDSVLAALDSDITLGFEARVAGQQPDDRNLRLAADSDLYKWLEGACYTLASTGDQEVRRAVDRIAGLIVGSQHPDGYINTQVPPKQRFDTTVNHDLYIAGHFFEAAVAHHRATGEPRLLEAACRWADLLLTEWEAGNPYFATVGSKEHSEYELSLLRLARETGETRYRDFAITLARMCEVGATVGDVHAGSSDLHAVRVGYLLAGCADLFLDTGDDSLLEHLPRLWSELVETRMYTTGAIGSHGEIISEDPFDLPHTQDHPHRTMGETCAAIAIVMFSWRMHAILDKAKPFDVIERIIYNHILGAVSLDGLAHFYYNPMRVVGDQSQRTDHWHVPATGRCRLPELNRTTCCMPNLWRFFGALPEYVFSTDGEGVAVNLFTDATASVPLPSGEVALSIATDYPNDGTVTIRHDGARAASFPLTLRVPVWARAARLRMPDGQWRSPPSGEHYAIAREWAPGDAVQLELDLTPQMLLTDTRVAADRDHVVVSRGPLRYCLESEDLSFPVEEAGVSLQTEEVTEEARTEWRSDIAGGLHTVALPGWRRQPDDHTPLTLVPWYARANRSDNSRWVIYLPHADGTGDVSAEQPDSAFAHLRSLAGHRRWRRLGTGPALAPRPYGAWDGWTLATMNVLKVEDPLHLYYEAGRTAVEDFQIGHATSQDGLVWHKDPANPVVPFGQQGTWDGEATWDPFVLFEDGVFKLWYGGTRYHGGDPNANDFQLGYATSTDGTHFEGRRQISSLSNRDNGLGQIADMHVVHDIERGEYVMYFYSMRDGQITIRRATSPNETDFDLAAAAPVVIDGETGPYRCPHVVVDDGTWHMHYCYKYQGRAGYAVSDDGISWRSANRNLIDGHHPEVLKVADDLFLLFCSPSQYNMGHEPGCDIRVAALAGRLEDVRAAGGNARE